MTARSLYDKYTDSLYASSRARWNGSTSRYETVFPASVPKAWPFISDDEKRVWKDLASRLTPRTRRS